MSKLRLIGTGKRMKRVAFVVAGSLALIASLPGIGASASVDTSSNSQSAASPQIDNLGRLIPEEEVTLDPMYHVVETALDDLSTTIPILLPDTFVESEVRASHGVVYVKGEAAPSLRAMVERTGAPITIVDGLPFSREELTRRMTTAHDRLAAHHDVAEIATTGFQNGASRINDHTERRQSTACPVRPE